MEDFSKYNGEGTLLRKMQLRLLDIVVEIDKICRRYNIRYWIDFGSLLGAVRHQGFIPWDDDLDISMPADDYEKFKEIAPKELPENLFLQTSESDPDFLMPILKVRDKNSMFITRHEDFTKDYNKGLYIDIFIVTDYPDINPKVRKFILKWISKVNWFMGVKHNITLKNHLATIFFPVIKGLCLLTWKVLCLKPKTKLGYDVSRYCPYGCVYSKEWVYPLSEVTFENHKFLAPRQPDKYLEAIYPNFMQIPPEEKRVTHIIHVEMH